MDRTQHIGIALAGLFLAAGIAVAGYFIGQTMLAAKIYANSATVRGLSERTVKADRAIWNIGYGVSAPSRVDLPDVAPDLQEIERQILAVLADAGIDGEAVRINAVEVYDRTYRNQEGRIVEQTFQLQGALVVDTAEVDLIRTAETGLSDLITSGLEIRPASPRYVFTGLNTIKPDMLREATENARIAAREFASNAGVKVGAIREARQGNFTIRDTGDPNSEFFEIDKLVRVITTIEFYLTE
ncbi:SIMPL domain-containing protein [Rhodobacteraceae bacterium NNCM2]|nr:SIMPL domain-containing protein [Coraliihabitans acroporae]